MMTKVPFYFFKRNNKKTKRDVVYNSIWVYKLINNLKGHTASNKVENLAYTSFVYLKRYYRISIPTIVFKFIKNQKLLFKITKVRKAGRLYNLPISFNEFNRYAVAMRSAIKQTRLQRSSNFISKVIEIFNSNILLHTSVTEKNRQEIYKTIVSFRGYLHYRWRV